MRSKEPGTLLFKKSTGRDFVMRASFGDAGQSNVMDRWILADCQSLLRFMDEEMRVIDNPTNWYTRFNRRRLKGTAGLGIEDTTSALHTVLQILFTIIPALAPFTPFIIEHIYQLLRPQLRDVTAQFQDVRSVHFLPFLTVQEVLFDQVIERQVSMMQKAIQLGRGARERRNLSLKTPLLSLVDIADAQPLSDVNSLKSNIQEELNAHGIILSDDERYNIRLKARVDWPPLGKRLKKGVQVKIIIEGIELAENDLSLVRVIGKGNNSNADGDENDGGGVQWEPAFADDMIVLLDTAPHPELVEESLACEIVNRFQRLRKKAGLVPTNGMHMRHSVVSDPDEVGIGQVVASPQEVFIAALRGKLEEVKEEVVEEPVILEEEQTVGNLVLRLQLARV
ncbi:Methionyl/Valyl/Leucyl/Isoleucyl-tRNA synthetase anticodon-binding domain-containing protein [Madurella fahalii]|uniref:Methionyl/Valyl/Leucyl/Isoleucyl-tRNA synthetase anticodon-binding domain-containing protein n=1 Tax=Madurella fahalii TaxID=1157608 RepID=A0ABQ0GD07_9PEZI